MRFASDISNFCRLLINLREFGLDDQRKVPNSASLGKNTVRCHEKPSVIQNNKWISVLIRSNLYLSVQSRSVPLSPLRFPLLVGLTYLTSPLREKLSKIGTLSRLILLSETLPVTSSMKWQLPPTLI